MLREHHLGVCKRFHTVSDTMKLTMFFAFSALIQLYAAPFSIATEPVCSKFSYEEKLLEKMIRTEIKVETMQNEIKKTEEAVLNTLVEIKKTALDIQDKFEGFSNDLTTKIVAQMKEMQSKEEQILNQSEELTTNITAKMENERDILAKLKEQFVNQFEELANNITVKMDNERDILAKLKEQTSNQFEELTNNVTANMENGRDILTKLKESIIQPSVAFHVHNVKDLVLDTNNEVLVFESIITNEGSGYDQSTGIFTAPFEGVYHFDVHVCSAYKKVTPIGLVLDSTFVARSINYDGEYYTCGSVSAIVRMKSGGQVWVASIGGSTGYVLNIEDTFGMNTFSGMLINSGLS